MKWATEEIARTSEEIRKRHGENRAAWNEAAEKYRMENEASVQLLKNGTSNLHPIERENLGRIGPLSEWCKRAIHLQCASGYDTMSLILEGVQEVIGIDISDIHIKNAEWRSQQFDFSTRWIRCDVLDTPTELDGSADLVYTGRGALCWIHDIDGWARVVYRLLKKGGVFSVLDGHPIVWLFDMDSSDLQCSGINYNSHAEWNKGWPEAYLGDMGKPVEEEQTKHEVLWKISDIFQALTNAGLTVEYIGEHADQYFPEFPKLSEADRAKIPMTFSMIARKLK
jgi:SAM-dependent methyltransferase